MLGIIINMHSTCSKISPKLLTTTNSTSVEVEFYIRGSLQRNIRIIEMTETMALDNR